MPSTNPRRAIATSAILVGVVVGSLALTRPAHALIEGTTYSSKEDNVRMTVPRGWRIADQPTYPGIDLRLSRTHPPGTILLAVDGEPSPIDPECRNRASSTQGAPTQVLPIEMQVACVQAKRLTALGFDVGPIKEAQRPWFDYQSKDHALRQGVVVQNGEVFTLILAADTPTNRNQYAHNFDAALRSIRELQSPSAAPSNDAGAAPTLDGGVPATQPSPPPASQPTGHP